MSNIQQLTSMISALNEKFNQLEQNSKRIFELPENENLNGNSKFAISRPLDLGEITEYTTLNAILEWCIEEMQNIENATRVVQMLPPELLSGPRRIKIPVVDGDDVDVPIVWKILGVDYVEDTEVIINIPDASEDNYRKDLILGTQDGDVIRMAGFESEEGVIEPIQPENTVLLTAITLFGSTVIDEPTEPIVGDVYVKKASQGWVGYQININSTQVAPTLAANHSIAFRAFANGHSIIGLNITSYVPDKIWSGATIGIRNDSDFPITLKHLYISSSKIRFNFPSGQDLILTKEMGVKYFKLGAIPTTGPAYAYCLNDFVSGGTTGDFIPLSGTEVGKPLTGEIEVDALNSPEGFAGFFSDTGGVGRRISMTDDGFNVIQNTDTNTNENSQINNTPQSTTITTTDADNNKAEIVVGDYGTVRFNSDIPNDGWSGYMYYNYEEGLQIKDNNSTDLSILRFNGISGRLNNNDWIIEKPYSDTTISNLLFPDSGSTPRRIPVSVNGNYANQQGDIELELTADNIDYDNAASGLLAETVQEMGDELSDKKLNKVTTGSTERAYAVNDLNQQTMIPLLQEFIDASETSIITAITTASYTNGIATLTPMTVNKGRKYVDTLNGTLYIVFENDTILRIEQ